MLGSWCDLGRSLGGKAFSTPSSHHPTPALLFVLLPARVAAGFCPSGLERSHHDAWKARQLLCRAFKGAGRPSNISSRLRPVEAPTVGLPRSLANITITTTITATWLPCHTHLLYARQRGQHFPCFIFSPRYAAPQDGVWLLIPPFYR